jgi:diguanylate cyclase (GGDEF)-like protein
MIHKTQNLSADGLAAVRGIYRHEEIATERRINKVALLISSFMLIFLLVLPQLTHSGYRIPNVISNLVGTSLYLIYHLAIFFILRAGLYHPVIKYLTITFSVTIITLVVFGYSFGVDHVHAARTVSLTVWFLVLALSGLYQNPGLPLFCGSLIAAEHVLLYLLALLAGQPVLFAMESFRANILTWDVLVVNVLMYLGTGLLMSLNTRRHRALSMQLQQSSERLLQEEEELRRSEEKARFFENFDHLTALPNIRHFRERLEGEIRKAESRRQLFVLLCLGLDTFKNVNQLHGTDTGHIVLQEVGRKLRATFRDDDFICRFMGDKFLVLLTDVQTSNHIPDLIRKTRTVFSTPVIVQGKEIKLTAGVGCCTYPHDGHTGEALIENAEAAMYRAKTEGKNVFCLYDEQLHQDLDLRIHIENELGQALERNELFLVYQPKVHADGRMVGMEALVRWQSPTRGLMPPDSFIPIAESSGLIIDIGYHVLALCCQQIRSWMAAGLPAMRITVNASPLQFGQADFVSRVLGIIASASIDPAWLGIEITEGGIMQNEDDCVGKMNALKAAGLSISIDDFGKGYSSLTRLGSYPLDTLKIDKAFVDELPDSVSSGCIVRSIIDLAHNLGYTVVAEGVETAAQLDFLVRSNCKVFQGYYFHKPLAPEDIRRLFGDLGSQDVTEVT